MNRTLTTLATLALAGTALAGTAAAQTGQTASAMFVDADGQNNGAATLTQTPVGVLIDLEVGGLPAESWVAFHIHETGECDAEEDHETAGEHFNPTGADHGFLVESGAHAGDMPNQYVPADGILRARVLNAAVSLEEGDEAGIRGRSLMIHADPDDYRSQPSGEAGDRIACAPIE
ncbi:MAG: superoxide dismutase family protein [Pararhodobacter sp.]